MNTTNLFVELIVIGVFAAAWVVLLLLACFGIPPWLTADLLNIFTAVPILAVVYVLGVITDRFADWVFEKLFFKRLREKYPEIPPKDGQDPEAQKEAKEPKPGISTDELRSLKLQILGRDRIGELAEYARSRARICRGVAFNTLLSLMAFHVLAAHSTAGISVREQILASIIPSTFIVAAWAAWHHITVAGLKTIRQHAEVVNQSAS